MSEKSLATTIQRGLLSLCPRCGQAGLFEGVLRVRVSCPSCQLDFSNEDSGDGSTVFLIFGIGLVGAIFSLSLIFGAGWSPWLVGGLMIVLVFALTVFSLRPAKALLIALAWHHNSGGVDDE